MTKPTKTKVYLIGVMGAAAWGLSFIVSKYALDFLTPEGIMTGRMIVAVVTMGCFVLVGIKKVKYSKKLILPVIGLGLLQPCIYGLLEATGIAMTTASEAAIILGLLPIMTSFFNGIFLKEPMTKGQIFFIFVSFAGVLTTTLFGGGFVLGGKAGGYIILLVAVTVASIYSIASRKLSAAHTPFELTFAMAVVGFIFFNAYNLLLGPGGESYSVMVSSSTLIWSLVFLGGVSFVGGFLSFNYFIAHTPAHIATAVSASVLTATGVVAGILVLGEAITISKVVGTVVIIGGVVGVNLSEKKRN